MVCGGIVVIGPDGVPRPGTPYVAPPEPPASVRFAGSPLVTISDFLAEFELLHLAEPLKASGAPAELYALYLAEGRTTFLNSLKAAGVANLKDRQAMANNLSKAGKGGRLGTGTGGGDGGGSSGGDLQAERPRPRAEAPPLSIVDLSDPDAMPARMRAAVERRARASSQAEPPIAAAAPVATRLSPAAGQQRNQQPPGQQGVGQRVLPQGAGQRMLAKRHWVVAGDTQNNSIARSVVQRLEGAGKTVHVVHPFDASGKAFKSLDAVGQPIEVIDLIINSFAGMKVVEQAAQLGVSQVFIQPGAGSPEIESFCASKKIEVHHGCVLREL